MRRLSGAQTELSDCSNTGRKMDFLHGEKVILKTETTFSFISVSTNNINEVFFTVCETVDPH